MIRVDTTNLLPNCYGLVGDILTCQDSLPCRWHVCNKSATSL